MYINTTRIFVFAFSLIALLAVVGCSSESHTFQVNDVVSDPGAFNGSLTIEGVVYAYAKDDAMILGVMDKKELQCTTPNCNKVLFPVKVGNPRPAIGDEIRVSGDIVKKDWGYLMQATKVDVVTNHKLGV